MLRLLFCLPVLLLPGRLRAQLPSPARIGGYCKYGLKLGTGVGFINTSAAPAAATAYTGGLSLAYRPNRPNFFSTIQLDALLERRAPRPWQGASATNATLFVPLYLRTDPDQAWFHLLAGAGPTFWLTGQRVPADQRATYATRAVEATLLTGVEVRLLPLRRYETTLALTYRFSLTADLLRSHTTPGGTTSTDDYRHRWIGLTVNSYLHPRPRS